MTDTAVDAARPPALTPQMLRIAPARRSREVLIRYVLFVAALVSVLVSALILWTLFSEAWTFIVKVSWADTWGQVGWFPRRGVYDIPTIVVPTLIVTAIAMLVAGPLGLGAAVYLSEYARPRVRAVLKPLMEVLAGIPSVVLGFFALTWVAPNIVGRIGKPALLTMGLMVLAAYAITAVLLARWRYKHCRGGPGEQSRLAGFVVLALSLWLILVGYALWLLNVMDDFAPAKAGSMAAAGIGVGLLSIPLVASVSEDAMAAVPEDLRQASAGLGARKLATSTRIVVPAAISGIVAAFIVATSRAIGETMVVFLAAGVSDAARFADSPFEGGMTMTAAMASLASGTDSVVGEGLTFQSLYFVGLLLFAITLSLNIVAARFVARVREQY